MLTVQARNAGVLGPADTNDFGDQTGESEERAEFDCAEMSGGLRIVDRFRVARG